MTNKLKIAVWNANGLSQHKLEVQAFLRDQQIDIMLISETHFTTRNKFNISNYTVYDTKHPDGKPHGGTAIIIKKGIRHFELSKYSEDHIQATSILLEEWSGQCTLSAIYCPPRHAITQDQFSNYFQTLGDKFLAGGDYNAKHVRWGSRLTSTKGRQLWNSICVNKLTPISTGQPTYWPTDRNKIPDLIDFCVTKNINSRYISAESYYDLSSDHSPVVVTLSTQALKPTASPKLTNKFTDWTLFKIKFNDLCDLNVQLSNEQNIDDAVKLLTENMSEAAVLSTPKENSKQKDEKLSRAVKKLLSEKRTIRKRFQITRAPCDKKKLNKAIKDLKKTLAKNRENELQHFLENLNPYEASDYSLWKATKKLKRPQVAQPAIRCKNGMWARSDQEKADTFASHLAQVFTPYPPEDSADLAEVSEDQTEYPAIKFTLKEVRSMIKAINPKKAPGFDLVTGKMIKELPEKGVRYFTYIANAIMRIGYFPEKWKLAQITMIVKPGKNNTLVESYRPISLLPSLSKLFEKLLLKKMEPVLQANNVIPDHQFGCRQKHSTVEQVHRVVAEVQQALDKKKYCSAIFLDVAQAFDKVWHEGLLQKIHQNLPLFYKILKSYLSDRKFKVNYQSATTPPHAIKSGVPQGSVLGAVLYQIFTFDLPLSSEVKLATYVDDTAMLSTHSNPNTASRVLQDHLNNIQQWLKTWRIKVNESKSAHITFTLKKKVCPSIYLNGVQIPRVDEIKYLGIHLDKKLIWKKHIEAKCKQLKIKSAKLNWLMGRRSNLSLESKVLLYKAILKPIWTYGVTLWGCASASNIVPVQRLQSKILRNLTNAPWYLTNESLHRDLQIKLVNEEISFYSSKYKERLSMHPNNLAVNLLNEPKIVRLKRVDIMDLHSRWT